MGPEGGRQGSLTPAKPLLGRRIVVTRARSQASSFSRALQGLGAEVIEFPTIRIVPPASYELLDQAIRGIESYHWIIFTSVNGVKHFWLRFHHLRRKIESLNGVRITAIGPETAKTLESAGLSVDLPPREYRAEGILQGLKPEDVSGRRVLLPRAAGARDILPTTLREWGAEVDVVEAYRTVSTESDPWFRKLLLERKIDMITFTSSSTVIYFARLFSGEEVRELFAGAAVACIGPITQRTAEGLGIRVDVVAREYTIPGLTQAIVDFFARQRQR
jgi:uroporphyrinogen III methyltransferase/synthase